MKYQVKPMEEHEAIEYLQWRYPEPYTFYNVPAAGFAECLAEILTPDNGTDYYAVYRKGSYYGIFCFNYQLQDLELGLGIRPEECGKHHGRQFTLAAVDYIRRNLLFKGRIWLRVADFNERAQRSYEGAGFKPFDQQLAISWHGLTNFIHMELPET